MRKLVKKWKHYWRASQHNKLGQDAQTPWLQLKKNYNHTLISLKLLRVLTICCLLYSAAVTFPFLFNFHHGIDSNVPSLGIIWEEFYHVPWASGDTLSSLFLKCHMQKWKLWIISIHSSTLKIMTYSINLYLSS